MTIFKIGNIGDSKSEEADLIAFGVTDTADDVSEFLSDTSTPTGRADLAEPIFAINGDVEVCTTAGTI